jgi:hypothetical protein
MPRRWILPLVTALTVIFTSGSVHAQVQDTAQSARRRATGLALDSLERYFASIRRLDASIARVQQASAVYHALLQRPNRVANGAAPTADEIQRAVQGMNALPILFAGGRRGTLGEVIATIRRVMTQDAWDRVDVPADSLWLVSPFRRLGAVRVGTSDSVTPGNALRVRDMFRPIEGSTQSEIRVPRDTTSNSLIIRYGHSWTLFIVAVRYRAWTRTLVDGVLSAEQQAANQLFEDLCGQGYWMFCGLANTSGEGPFDAYYISARVCAQWVSTPEYSSPCWEHDDWHDDYVRKTVWPEGPNVLSVSSVHKVKWYSSSAGTRAARS